MNTGVTQGRTGVTWGYSDDGFFSGGKTLRCEWVRVSGDLAYASGEYSDSVGHGGLDNLSFEIMTFYGMRWPWICAQLVPKLLHCSGFAYICI